MKLCMKSSMKLLEIIEDLQFADSIQIIQYLWNNKYSSLVRHAVMNKEYRHQPLRIV